ncbi:hypothetical protein GQ44DRAFT_767186 [Phaeosphaeriaceae sp. PMI808]|nr:hypothetical protein GQ44DRAFT_767186 [Phaeosphaeriaceae sp. PMI808]
MASKNSSSNVFHHHNMQPQRDTTFNWMGLPQELKQMVCGELWLETPPMIFKPSSLQGQKLDGLLVRYGISQQDAIIGLPKWLLANRDIQTHGLNQLWLETTVCWFDSNIDYNNLEPKLSPLIRRYIPTKAQFDVQMYEGNSRFQMVPSSAAEDQIIQLLPKLNSKTKVLNLAMTYWFVDKDNSSDKRPWKIRFPRFAGFNGLDLEELNVRLEIFGEELSDDGTHSSDIADIRTAMETKVALLGAGLIRGGGNIRPRFECQERYSPMPTTALIFQARNVRPAAHQSGSIGLSNQPWRWSVESA